MVGQGSDRRPAPPLDDRQFALAAFPCDLDSSGRRSNARGEQYPFRVIAVVAATGRLAGADVGESTEVDIAVSYGESTMLGGRDRDR